MACGGCAKRRAALKAAVAITWEKLNGLGLMSNGARTKAEIEARERIAQQFEEKQQQMRARITVGRR
jgi:hypothetical protein